METYLIQRNSDKRYFCFGSNGQPGFQRSEAMAAEFELEQANAVVAKLHNCQKIKYTDENGYILKGFELFGKDRTGMVVETFY